MSNLPPLDYSHDGTVLHGRIARPDGGVKRPGVLVMHHALGQCEHDCKRAQDLADLGYVALVCDMYGTGLRDLQPHEFQDIMVRCQSDPDFFRARVNAAYDALIALPDVDSARIGAIGFCFGGQCVLELARSGANVRAVVSLHGLLKTGRPAATGKVKARVLAITGALDPYVPIDDVTQFQAEMAAADADWHLTIYGKGMHAFTDPAVEAKGLPGVRYDPVLDSLSWAATTDFLGEAFRTA